MATAKPKTSKPASSKSKPTAASAKPDVKSAPAKQTPAKATAKAKTASKAKTTASVEPAKPAAPMSTAKKAAKKTPGVPAGTRAKKTPGIAAAAKKTTKVQPSVSKASPRKVAAVDEAPATKAVVDSELQVGSKAPPFDLLGDDGKRHSLSEFKGKRVVLYFYPKDDTPGCTKEACQFSELPGFEKLGVPVLGVSADSIESHKKFRAKYKLTVGLLSDPGNTVALQYGAYGEKVMYGKRVVGTKRSTFLIGPDGRIEKIWRNVRADGHAAEVFAVLAR